MSHRFFYVTFFVYICFIILITHIMSTSRIISLSDYVTELSEFVNFAIRNDSETSEASLKIRAKTFSKIEKYSNFLKQQLSVSMFVPCDKTSGLPLQKPKEYDDYLSEHGEVLSERVTAACNNYKRALENVLFKGFQCVCRTDENGQEFEYVYITSGQVFSIKQINSSTVEGLLVGYRDKFVIALTDKAMTMLN